MDSKNADRFQPWKVAAVVSFYMCAALVMVFVNKAVLNSSPDLPLVFLLIQLILAVVLLHASALITPKVEIPKLKLETAKKLMPVTLVNVIGLVFNILCLRGVEASFFQIARGLVLPLTIMVSSVHTHTRPSARVVLAAFAVTMGFFLGVAPSSFFSLSLQSLQSLPSVPVRTSGLSILYGVLSSLFIAVHSVLIKLSLPHAGNSTIQLAYWQNLGSALFLFPVIILQGEFEKLAQLVHTPSWNCEVFVWGSIVTGVFGFLLCVAGLLSIKVTSPITHMFSSAARSVIQTLLGVWLFGDLLTTNRAASILVIMLGTVYYTWAKAMENAPRPIAPRDSDLEASRGLAKEQEGMQEIMFDLQGDEKEKKARD
ncbi:uncharacterized protein LAESUDRAFT_661707 [Laetiporus sulphureus 93-53]|uniref:Sugar phosphate transporter domain-containing protein n=1 Tax=Laetiporus sulphureus 93-53 TaxID=1314785 RepID=A0A165C9J1_9APHY|nr:uncharacterized protein LAESUDRAFT_661707 [Laetiporus sulphureus 93-53]KZT02436.1 hypothetical protein LAESUDRAFT_661707 [Laetiporus sulphureus 93-53]